MIRVGIVGASGYTGVELARLLCRHPEVEITVATSRQYAGQALSTVFPNLRTKVDIVCENLAVDELLGRADFFFAAVPHKTAMAIVPPMLAAGKKVVDLSADFRLADAAVYEEWYQEHTAPELLATAVYGLPEIHRQRIKTTPLVANPGCYPTSVILALAPLLAHRLIDPATVIVDSKSGTSGAGRSAAVGTLYCEVADGFRAYKVGEHRHTPEIEQELGKLAGKPMVISFTPHLVPMSRGILSTCYAQTIGSVSQAEIDTLYRDYYRGEQFVRVCEAGTYPATQYVRGSNFCDLGFKVDPRTGRIVVVSAIDNIVKGAAGQAVQNMNLLCGFPEGMGLDGVGFFP